MQRQQGRRREEEDTLRTDTCFVNVIILDNLPVLRSRSMRSLKALFASLSSYAQIQYSTQLWGHSFVQWSPLVTCLATIHGQGAALWGRGEVLQSSHALHSPSGMLHAVLPAFLPWRVCRKLINWFRILDVQE